MKRFGSFIILLLYVAAILYASVELVKVRMEEKATPPILGTITLYTDIPTNMSTLLAEEYERESHIRVLVMPLTEQQMGDYLKKDAPLNEGDIVITSRDHLIAGAENGSFISHVTEEGDMRIYPFRDPDFYWVGTWLNPIVFVEQNNFIQRNGKPILSWEELGTTQNYRLVAPDMAATKTASNILFSFVEMYGEEGAMQRFLTWKPHILQYAKFMSTAVRLAMIGEADIGIGNYSEVKSFESLHPSVKIIFPAEGTPYYLTGVAILKQPFVSDFTFDFYRWLLSKKATEVLEKNQFYLVPTNPESPMLRDGANQGLALFPTVGKTTEEGANYLIKQWISKVRF